MVEPGEGFRGLQKPDDGRSTNACRLASRLGGSCAGVFADVKNKRFRENVYESGKLNAVDEAAGRSKVRVP
ncbi:hypothetical protein GRAN_3753 [Granulicella sibirica]|uniref:Uncharacterized protein n=1 Tax=Granulicella sibirica TaxID=2479048 RepID=A0A4Q0SYP2_9BACT|nr:hypothetical protein GRAN_3753 [Granulicella sibirica]